MFVLHVMLITRTKNEIKQNFMNSIKIQIFHLAFNMSLKFTNTYTPTHRILNKIYLSLNNKFYGDNGYF